MMLQTGLEFDWEEIIDEFGSVCDTDRYGTDSKVADI